MGVASNNLFYIICLSLAIQQQVASNTIILVAYGCTCIAEVQQQVASNTIILVIYGELRGSQAVGVASNNLFDCVLLSILYMLKPVQSPFLGTPLVKHKLLLLLLSLQLLLLLLLLILLLLSLLLSLLLKNIIIIKVVPPNAGPMAALVRPWPGRRLATAGACRGFSGGRIDYDIMSICIMYYC